MPARRQLSDCRLPRTTHARRPPLLRIQHRLCICTSCSLPRLAKLTSVFIDLDLSLAPWTLTGGDEHEAVNVVHLSLAAWPQPGRLQIVDYGSPTKSPSSPPFRRIHGHLFVDEHTVAGDK
ncbi:hypothetical protein CKAH01_11206 [Colletotrichum kahawae]|uniref:Uncharacterized protein n=1 Tax=Colletotrichum kahawae TaxID=34407 RepID=A0AAD9XWU2_COLKA|nr:hypothetical protein CKAH01_11206 [Colletotrichum kahawae]